ncbi:hypothetical protein [Aeromicrobium sp. Root495]|uniref:hypothetical protein n=1 Tax=Aeromicrobium sp. Root495 TaxID=1736550 RepID=UPI0012E88834|nr:hypothetical protein [Aeromicrobium sp. Root495]
MSHRVMKNGLRLAAALLLVVAVPAAAGAEDEVLAPHLPTEVNAPGTWSGEEGLDGPLAAIGLAERSRTDGLTGRRQSREMFGVSADDGRSQWLDLPGVDEDTRPLARRFALSPDGRWIGWSRIADARAAVGRAALEGWSVMDTVTGQVRRLRPPTQAPTAENKSHLAFSGDSRHLVARYDTASRTGAVAHELTAWDVRTGASTVLESTRTSVPRLGSAPSGVVWIRGGTVHRQDPGAGEKQSFALPGSVRDASWAPDDKAFAYLSASTADGPPQLRAGRTIGKARGRAVPLDVEPGRLAGWRDDDEVVVGHAEDRVEEVDVVTKKVRGIDLAGQVSPLERPILARGLWEEPLKAPVVPGGTDDPRFVLYGIAGGLVALLALGGAFSRRRPRSS